MIVVSTPIIEHDLDQAVLRLLEMLKGQPRVDLALVEKAVHFGMDAHQGQLRKSGEPYFIHPVRVAIEVANYDMSTLVIIGALLHDVIEDTEKTSGSITELFGEEAADLVGALTKVKESKNLTLYKIFELGKKDFRVFLIKLLDRIDNLSDMEALTPEKKRRVCEETLNIYVEVAHGLGLAEIESRLKDLVFRQLYPRVYERTAITLKQLFFERREAITRIEEQVALALEENGWSVQSQFISPEEYLYAKGEVTQVLDSLIVEVEEPIDCYRALGLVHMKHRSVPLTVRDYISNPRGNGWRGLSSKILVKGEPVMIHFVTEEFQRKNRLGILALMNEGVYRSSNYQQFLQLYLDLASDNVRVDDVFRFNKEKNIQLFTPTGDVVELRYGATILDFAFAIHSELGIKAVGGVIDEVRYPRNKILEDGMVVTVLTVEHSRPDADWLEMVVMPKSRKEILKYLTRQQKGKG